MRALGIRRTLAQFSKIKKLTTSDIPQDVISDIFSRLPVKSLLRFRCLSKPSRALIDSPNFIKSHLHHSLNSNSHRSIITSGDCLYSIDFDLLDKPNLLNFPGTQVLGSCNGLLCLLSDHDIFLCNPSTREVRKLPVSDIENHGNSFRFTALGRVTYGFGYDYVNDDYKVVRIALFYKEVKNEVRVYSLKSNSWRRIYSFHSYLCCMGYSVLVNGALHWAATLHPIMEDVITSSSDDFQIISFDLASEECHMVPQPRYSKIDSLIVNVGELAGRLCVHCNFYMKYTDIWVMNHYGQKDSWTKLLSVAQPVDIHKFDYLNAIAYSKDEKQVLLEQEGGKLLWYDLKLKSVKHIRIPVISKLFHACLSHGSLVKLTGGARTDVTRAESKIGKAPKRDDFLSKGFKLKL